MKTLKPIMAALLTALFAISIISCSDEEPIEAYCDNFEYLELPDNTDFNNLTVYEKSIVQKAFLRVESEPDENGIFTLLTSSGKEINVSENIFSHIKNQVDENRNYFLNNGISLRNRLLTRSDDGLCFGVAIERIKTNIKASDYIQRKYGSEGVPIDEMGLVLNELNIKYSEVNPATLANKSSLTNSIVVYRYDYDAHAVNGIEVDQLGYVVFYDYHRDGIITNTENQPKRKKYKENIDMIFILE